MSETAFLTLEEVERSGSVEPLHRAVATALDQRDMAEVDRLLAIWSKFNRRRRAVSALASAANLEAEAARIAVQGRKPIEDMTDDEVCAELERLVGRAFTIQR